MRLAGLVAVVALVVGCEREHDAVVTHDHSSPAGARTPVDAGEVRDATDKRATIKAMLARGPVLIHLDARRAGVIVPAHYHPDSNLVLQIGTGLAPEIADLDIGAAAISATLSFDHKPFHCVVPWPALYGAMVENAKTGTLWPDDVPPDGPQP